MSKRQSRSAEFIGSFHRLDRNAIDDAEHVKRWKTHVERWLRQLAKAQAQRMAAQADSAQRPSRNDRAIAEAARLTLEAKAKRLKERELELVEKIEAVLAKIAGIGFSSTGQELRKIYKPLRDEIFLRPYFLRRVRQQGQHKVRSENQVAKQGRDLSGPAFKVGHPRSREE